jgi:hypothetical protein
MPEMLNQHHQTMTWDPIIFYLMDEDNITFIPGQGLTSSPRLQRFIALLL